MGEQRNLTDLERMKKENPDLVYHFFKQHEAKAEAKGDNVSMESIMRKLESTETKIEHIKDKAKREDVMRFAAIIRIAEQCSPDDFEWNTYIKEITPNTTISDLLEWQRNTLKYIKNIRDGKTIHKMLIQEME